GRDSAEKERRGSLPARLGALPPEAEPTARGLLDRMRRARDELDRRLVALSAGLAPRDQTVLLEEDRPGRRVLFEQHPDSARQVEPGSLVVQPDDLVAEVLLREVPPWGRRGQRDD